jgi:hypothetical protein
MVLSTVVIASCSDFQPRQSSVAQGQFFDFEDSQSFRNLTARKQDDLSFNWPATIAARNLAQRGITERDLDHKKIATVKCALGTNYLLWWYARVPDGVQLRSGDYVEFVAGVPFEEFGPLSHVVRVIEAPTREAHYRTSGTMTVRCK